MSDEFAKFPEKVRDSTGLFARSVVYSEKVRDSTGLFASSVVKFPMKGERRKT
jgi:hypothetical protein